MHRLILLIAALPLFAQDVVEEQISVVVRDIRVHVVDRDGAPVTGLKAEDFILREGKKDQGLSFFEEVDLRTTKTRASDVIDLTDLGEGAVVQPAGRAVILFLDTSNIGPNAFDPMIQAAQALVRTEVRPGVQMKILHFDERLHHLSPFSDDVEMLVDALGMAKHRGDFRRALLKAQSDIVDAMEKVDIARSLLRDNRDEAGVNQQEDDLAEAIIEKERLKLSHFRSYFYQMEAMAQMLGPHPHTKAIYHLSGGVYLQPAGGQYLDTRTQADRLARELNRQNVTVYSFVQADKIPIGDNLRIATLRGPTPAQGAGNRDFEDSFQLQSGPVKLSEGTGGFFFRADGTQTIEDEVRAMQSAGSHYYRLVYTIDPNTAGERIRIKLADKNLKAKVLYGKRIGKKKPWKRLNKVDRQLAFESALFFSREKRNELNCRFSFNRFPGVNNKVIIPVSIDLPMEKPPENGYELGLAAVGPAEAVFDVTQATIVKPPKASGLRLHHVLVADHDPETVRFYVRNMDTGAFSLHEAQVKEPLLRPETFYLSEVVLSQDDDYRLLPLNLMTPNEKKKKGGRKGKDRKTTDPLIMGEMLVRGNAHLVSGKPLKMFFHLNNFKGDPAKLGISLQVMKGTQSGKAPFQQLGMAQLGDQWRVYGQIPTLALPPGEYELMVQAVDVETREAYTRIVPLVIRETTKTDG